jgi:hypothetical protein
MDNLRFEEIDECIDVRIDALKEALPGHSTQFIECSGINSAHASIAVLDQSSFLEACLAFTPPVVFVYREVSLLEDQIAATMSKISDDPIEQDRLKKMFLSSVAVLMEDAWKTCPEYSLAQCFFSAGVSLILMGLEVVAYAEFMDALSEFEETARNAKTVERKERDLQLALKLQKISKHVAEDKGFISLRGRRKRAMYVLQHYRAEIPESRQVERPDPGSDLIDKNVVLVSRKAADIIEFGLCAPPVNFVTD